MHVAFICNEYPPGTHGGIGSFTRTLGRRLVGEGHRVTVIGTYPARDELPVDRVEDDRGVQVIRLVSRGRIPGWRAVSDQRRLWQRLAAVDAAEAIDVVEGPEPSLWAAPRHLGFPAVVRIHGGHRFFAVAESREPARMRSWFEARSIRRADDLMAVSAYVGRRTAELARTSATGRSR